MTRRAAPPIASTFEADEATGTRPTASAPGAPPKRSAVSTARRLLDAGRNREALNLLEAEVSAGREKAEVQFWLGRAALRLGDQIRAQRALSRAVTLSPHDPQNHRWLARVLLPPANRAPLFELESDDIPEVEEPTSRWLRSAFEPPTTPRGIAAQSSNNHTSADAPAREKKAPLNDSRGSSS